MLTAQGCADRRERLWNAIDSSCDFLILSDPTSLNYFSNYVSSPFVFRNAEAGAILILARDRSILVADNVLGPFLDAAHVDERVAPVWYEAKKSAPSRQSTLIASTLERLRSVAGMRVGVEMYSVPSDIVEGIEAERKELELLDIGQLIRPLRRQKHADELAVMNRSMRAGEAAQAAALAQVRPGMTELDVYRICLNAAIQSAGEPVVLYGDFASGPRCETERGGSPTKRPIETGDLLLLDFSVIIDGYRGDFTNTFAVGGGPTSGQRELFEACVGALNAGESKLKAGAMCSEVDAAIHQHFDKLDDHFGSHSGHGLGLGHPEPPYIVKESDEELVVGDIVALEPGLYIEGVGGMRYERNYLITADGFETLSHHEIRIEQ